MKDDEDSPRKLRGKELARVREIVKNTPMSVVIYSECTHITGKPWPPSLSQEEINGFYELMDIEKWFSVYKEMYKAFKEVLMERPEFAARFVGFKGFKPRKHEDFNTISQMATASFKGHLRL